MRILIIEDNQKLAAALKDGLIESGFVIDCLFDGEQGQLRIETSYSAYDLVILDVMLPKRDGMTVCKNIRSQKINIPILMLTAKDTIADKVTGLNYGADDYLVKPFAFDELLARVHALLRRPQNTLAPELIVGNLTLNPLTKQVAIKGRGVTLTQKEFTILEFMMRNSGRVLNRQEIIDHAWEYDFTPYSNLVDARIKNIRKKIDPDNKLIQTVRGMGYLLNSK